MRASALGPGWSQFDVLGSFSTRVERMPSIRRRKGVLVATNGANEPQVAIFPVPLELQPTRAMAILEGGTPKCGFVIKMLVLKLEALPLQASFDRVTSLNYNGINVSLHARILGASV